MQVLFAGGGSSCTPGKFTVTCGFVAIRVYRVVTRALLLSSCTHMHAAMPALASVYSGEQCRFDKGFCTEKATKAWHRYGSQKGNKT